MILKDNVKNTLKELFISVNSHLMNDEAPSKYLEEASGEPEFREFPFSLLYKLKETEQSPVFHPEGSVWNHTLMVTDEAALRRGESKDARALMWAALLHDIGKPPTQKIRKGRITAYDHDKEGALLADKFLEMFTEDRDFIARVYYLVRYHMQPLYLSKRREFLDLKGIIKNGDFRELALLSLCDRLGRLGDRSGEREENEMFIKLCEEASLK